MFFVITYIAAIVTANLAVAQFGPWFSVINSFALIGLDLALRDKLHDMWRGNYLWPRMLLLIASAGTISYLLNPASGMIAIASMVAFCAAGLVDAAAYHALRHRQFLRRANGSNIAGAAADSVLFPTIAFGGFMLEIVAMQFAAKVLGGSVWAYLMHRARRDHQVSL